MKGEKGSTLNIHTHMRTRKKTELNGKNAVLNCSVHFADKLTEDSMKIDDECKGDGNTE